MESTTAGRKPFNNLYRPRRVQTRCPVIKSSSWSNSSNPFLTFTSQCWCSFSVYRSFELSRSSVQILYWDDSKSNSKYINKYIKYIKWSNERRCIAYVSVTAHYPLLLLYYTPQRSRHNAVKVKVKRYSSSYQVISELRGVTCHVGSPSTRHKWTRPA